LIVDALDAFAFMEWLRVAKEDDRVTVDRQRFDCSLGVMAQYFSVCPMYDPRASQFWNAAIRSGLLDAESLTACWDAIEPRKRDVPEHIDRRLARRAVESNLLSFWQAQQLLAGRSSGYRVDRYLLLDLIGQGGMGRVYLARDTRLNRLVALKILAPERLSKSRAVARFQREALVGAQLQHEHLVRIYDFGESSGRYFLVMEYIEGKTIGTLISEHGPMPSATAVRLLRQVALGLDHAHRKGLIHRDVNPHNILVTHDGTAKLADLGLAIAMADEDRFTRDGATVGTFDYVAPEQARHSRAADIRSDIYSLGCTIYHMCSGNVPFPGSLPEKLYGHQWIEPTPLCRLVSGFPEGLSEIVERMMKKSPDQRFATPLQVALALEPYGDDQAGAQNRTGESPVLEPLGVEPAQPSSDETHRHQAEPASSGSREFPPHVATNPNSIPDAADPAAPLLTPDDDADEPAGDVGLILDPDPERLLSAGQSRLELRSSSDDSAQVSVATGLVGRLAPFWLRLMSRVRGAAAHRFGRDPGDG
jgi:serine/threonine protein kinase